MSVLDLLHPAPPATAPHAGRQALMPTGLHAGLPGRAASVGLLVPPPGWAGPAAHTAPEASDYDDDDDEDYFYDDDDDDEDDLDDDFDDEDESDDADEDEEDDEI